MILFALLKKGLKRYNTVQQAIEAYCSDIHTLCTRDTNQLEITKGETTNNAENETDQQCSSTSMFFRMFDIRLNENSSELFHMEQNYDDKLLQRDKQIRAKMNGYEKK